MKKRAIISMVLAMTMLAGCAKTEQIEETTADETTAETTVETTADTTAAATPTPRPTATPTPLPTPTPEPTPTAPVADDYDPEFDYYAKTMEFVQSLEEEHPGENRYFTTTHYGWLALVAVHPDNTYSGYFISGGEYVLWREGDFTVSTYEDQTLDAEAFAQIPCVYEMYHNGRYSFDEGVPADGCYTGNVLALSEDGNSVIMSCGTFIQYDADYVASLEVGDVVKIPGMDDATVTGIADDGYVFLDNGYLIRKACVNTGDTHSWYLSDGDGDYAEYVVQGTYELPISASCTITETSSFDWDYDTLAEYQAEIAASDTPFAASCLGHKIVDNTDFTNNGYYTGNTLMTAVAIRYEVRDGEIVSIEIDYLFGVG